MELQRTYFKRGTSFAGNAAARNKKLKRAVALSGNSLITAIASSRLRAIKPEVKTVDFPETTTSFTIFSGPPTGILITPPVLGTGTNNRIGNKVQLKSVRVRGLIQPNNNAFSTLVEILRHIIVFDRNPNGALASYADIIQAISSAGATSSTVFSSPNINNTNRFIILRDSQVVTPAAQVNITPTLTSSIAIDQTTKLSFDEFIPLKKLQSQFKATAGAIGDITSGALLMFFVSRGGQPWSMTYEARTRYYDV